MSINIKASSQPDSAGFNAETSDLWKRPIYKARAFHSTYRYLAHPQRPREPSPHARPAKHTNGLDIGAQSRLIAAAFEAYNRGDPINTLLTVRWESLLQYDDCHPLRSMSAPERIAYLVDLIRRWLKARGLSSNYIWVREVSDVAHEHWHLGFHLPKGKRQSFVQYLDGLMIEPLAPCPRSASKQTRGEFACSDFGSWHLAGEISDGKPQFAGYWIAAYLGKGEPSQRMFRGQRVNNIKKPVRGREFGGYVKGDRYDVPQGHIEGTTTRKGRFDMARALKGS